MKDNILMEDAMSASIYIVHVRKEWPGRFPFLLTKLGGWLCTEDGLLPRCIVNILGRGRNLADASFVTVRRDRPKLCEGEEITTGNTNTRYGRLCTLPPYMFSRAMFAHDACMPAYFFSLVMRAW